MTTAAPSAASGAPEGETRQPVVLSRNGDGERVEIVLRAPEDLIHFRGHFPGAPILPGVVQLDWAVRFAREAFGLRGEPRRIGPLKFHRVIRPGAVLTLDMRHHDRRVDWEIRSTAGLHASGRLHWT